MKAFLLYIWQLPQHLLGCFLVKVYKLTEVILRNEHVWVRKELGFGVSLGKYILLPVGSSRMTVMHERGHSLQSLYLGPLYLFTVGIASAVFCNLWDQVFHRKWSPDEREKWYYARWPENWADRLGGVDRSGK